MVGFDSLALLTDDQLAAFANRGYRFAGAYLEVLTAEYVSACFDLDLAILLLSEARTSELSAQLGAASALQELARCHALGVPAGVNVDIDFEDFTGPPEVGCEYIDAFAAGLVQGAQPPILYVASPQPLSGAQLAARPNIHLYHSGASDNPDLVGIGYSIFQLLPTNFKPAWGQGATVDLDIISRDRRGRIPMLWFPS